MFDVAVIGCGIVGAAAAYELSMYELSVAVLEKENDVAAGTTKANSAIIHAGYDPVPNTLMARLNVEGARLAAELFKKLDIPHKKCGALVLAFSEQELSELKHLLKNGWENGVPGLEIIGREQLLKTESNLSGEAVAALHAPSAMIVSPWEYALALAETAVQNGAELMLEHAVTEIERRAGGGYIISTDKGEVEARYILNAAGLYADEIHNMICEPSFAITPDRGEYCILDKSEGSMVNRVIFQCPTEVGKGVLIAPTVHGNLIVGPNNEHPEDRGDFATTREGLDYVMKTAKKSAPGINFRASIRNFAGNRAKSDHSDFIIAEAKDAKGFIDLAGIKSPGLSAAPAIAKMAARLLEESGLLLKAKDKRVDARKRLHFNELNAEQKAELIAREPAYGRVICRCETVTEGEIIAALNAPIPPCSVDGVKRRVGAGMGRCQGGFCGPRVVELLAGYYGLEPSAILQDSADTFILTGETKEGRGDCACSKDQL